MKKKESLEKGGEMVKLLGKIKEVISAYIKLFLLKYFDLTVLNKKEHEEFISRLADRLKKERSIWFEILNEAGFTLRTEVPAPHNLTIHELRRGVKIYILEFGQFSTEYKTDGFFPLDQKEIAVNLLRRMMNKIITEGENG